MTSREKDDHISNVTRISRGPYGDEPETAEDPLLDEYLSTLDPEKHRILPDKPRSAD